jgi:hypothetical protein
VRPGPLVSLWIAIGLAGILLELSLLFRVEEEADERAKTLIGIMRERPLLYFSAITLYGAALGPFVFMNLAIHAPWGMAKAHFELFSHACKLTFSRVFSKTEKTDLRHVPEWVAWVVLSGDAVQIVVLSGDAEPTDVFCKCLYGVAIASRDAKCLDAVDQISRSIQTQIFHHFMNVDGAKEALFRLVAFRTHGQLGLREAIEGEVVSKEVSSRRIVVRHSDWRTISRVIGIDLDVLVG